MKKIRRKIRRRIAAFLAVCMVATSCTQVAFAVADDSVVSEEKTVFELDGDHLRAEMEMAIQKGNRFEEDAVFYTDDAMQKGLYQYLLEQESLYEVQWEQGWKATCSNAVPSPCELTILVRPDYEELATGSELRLYEEMENGAYPGYRMTGREQVIFLLRNLGDEETVCQIEVDGRKSPEIIVPGKSALLGDLATPSELEETEESSAVEISDPEVPGAEKPGAEETAGNADNAGGESETPEPDGPETDETEPAETQPETSEEPEEPGTDETESGKTEPEETEESKPEPGETEGAASEPGETESGESEPEPVIPEEPEGNGPETGESEAGNPETGETGNDKPDTGETDTSEPDDTDSGNSQTDESEKTENTEPEGSETGGEVSGNGESGTEQGGSAETWGTGGETAPQQSDTPDFSENQAPFVGNAGNTDDAHLGDNGETEYSEEIRETEIGEETGEEIGEETAGYEEELLSLRMETSSGMSGAVLEPVLAAFFEEIPQEPEKSMPEEERVLSLAAYVTDLEGLNLDGVWEPVEIFYEVTEDSAAEFHSCPFEIQMEQAPEKWESMGTPSIEEGGSWEGSLPEGFYRVRKFAEETGVETDWSGGQGGHIVSDPDGTEWWKFQVTEGSETVLVCKDTYFDPDERYVLSVTAQTGEGAGTEIQFPFEIELEGISEAVQTVSYQVGEEIFTEDTADGSAFLQVQLADGETLRIQDLPRNTRYSIAEPVQTETLYAAVGVENQTDGTDTGDGDGVLIQDVDLVWHYERKTEIAAAIPVQLQVETGYKAPDNRSPETYLLSLVALEDGVERPYDGVYYVNGVQAEKREFEEFDGKEIPCFEMTAFGGAEGADEVLLELAADGENREDLELAVRVMDGKEATGIQWALDGEVREHDSFISPAFSPAESASILCTMEYREPSLEITQQMEGAGSQAPGVLAAYEIELKREGEPFDAAELESIQVYTGTDGEPGDSGESQPFGNGIFSVPLNGWLYLTGMWEGTDYTVREGSEDPSGRYRISTVRTEVNGVPGENAESAVSGTIGTAGRSMRARVAFYHRMEPGLGDMVIKKTVEPDGESNTFLYEITGTDGSVFYTSVTVPAGEREAEQTLHGIPAGVYTVTEMEHMRYESDQAAVKKEIFSEGTKEQNTFCFDGWKQSSGYFSDTASVLMKVAEEGQYAPETSEDDGVRVEKTEIFLFRRDDEDGDGPQQTDPSEDI